MYTWSHTRCCPTNPFLFPSLRSGWRCESSWRLCVSHHTGLAIFTCRNTHIYSVSIKTGAWVKTTASSQWPTPVFRAADMMSLTTTWLTYITLHCFTELSDLRLAGYQDRHCYTRVINKPHTLVPHFTRECFSSEYEIDRQNNTRKSPATTDRTLFDVTSLSPRADSAHAHVCAASKVLLPDQSIPDLSFFFSFFFLQKRCSSDTSLYSEQFKYA